MSLKSKRCNYKILGTVLSDRFNVLLHRRQNKNTCLAKLFHVVFQFSFFQIGLAIRAVIPEDSLEAS